MEGYRFENRLFGGQGIFGSLEDLGLADGYFLGKALGSFLSYKHEKIYACLATDNGARALQLESEVARGLLECGVRVLSFSSAPTPLVRFAATELNAQLAVSITSESLPAEYNGVKILLEGFALDSERAQQLQNIAASGNWRTREGGKLAKSDGLDAYTTRLFADAAWADSASRVERRSIGRVVFAQSEGGALAGVLGAIAERLAPIIEKVSVVEGVQQMRKTMRKDSQPGRGEKQIGLLFNRDGTALQVFDACARAVPSEALFVLLLREAKLVGGRKTVLVDSLFSDSCVRELRSIGAQVKRRASFGAELFANIGRERGLIAAASCDGHIALMDRYYAFEDACYVALRLLAIFSKRRAEDWDAILRITPAARARAGVASRIKRVALGVSGAGAEKLAAIAKLRAWLKAQEEDSRDGGSSGGGTGGAAAGQEDERNGRGGGREVERRTGSWRWIIRAADFEDILLMRSEGLDASAMKLAQDDLDRAMKDCGISDKEAEETVGFISHL